MSPRRRILLLGLACAGAIACSTSFAVLGGDDGGAGDAQPSTSDANVDATGSDDASGGSSDALADSPTDASRPSFPASCADVGSASWGLQQTFYLDHDPSKPWQGRCRAVSGGVATYLVLAHAAHSSYPLGGCATASTGEDAGVTTTWTMVRFDPSTRVVHTDDLAGATSVGGTHEVSGGGMIVHDYHEMPFGSARSCLTAAALIGDVDLTGTSFRFAATQTFPIQGFQGVGDAAVSVDRERVLLYVGGFPAGIAPCGQDYYMAEGGPCVVLEYAP